MGVFNIVRFLFRTVGMKHGLKNGLPFYYHVPYLFGSMFFYPYESLQDNL